MKYIAYSFFLLIAFNTYAQRYKVIANVAGEDKIDVSRIDAKRITHLNYDFASIIEDKIAFIPSHTNDSLNLVALRALKTTNPKLKILISIGGEQGSENFSKALSDDDSREQLIASILQFIKRYQLDGVELHWIMVPTGKFENKYNPTDHYNYALLIEDLRAALNEQSLKSHRGKDNFYILSMAGSNKRQYLWFSKFTHVIDDLDYINVETYDYKTEILSGGGVSKRPISGHHTNLCGSRADAWPRRSADQTILEYEAHGLPAEKLMLGIACYGKGWYGVEDAEHGLCQMTDGVLQKDFSYRAIIDTYLHKGYTRYWDKYAKASYLYNANTREFISYESKKSVRKKARYVRQHKMAGIVIDGYLQDNKNQLLHTAYCKLQWLRLPF